MPETSAPVGDASAEFAGYLLDTSAVLALTERRNEQIVKLIRDADRPPTGSMTVLGELAHGVAASPTTAIRTQRESTVTFYRRLVRTPDHYPWTMVAARYGDASAAATAGGLRLGMNDRWIVAECVAFGAILVTCDETQARLAAVCENAVALIRQQ
ncbi:MAG TPA: PIN domain-containing protein [Ilumatobacteraceae bacterium]|nr:PIN domain-containing protein [Ilumatobacteraceae bacterium]HRB02554.1 PIN domain-containing protein [Ilumatobacteraceae bacterium]